MQDTVEPTKMSVQIVRIREAFTTLNKEFGFNVRTVPDPTKSILESYIDIADNLDNMINQIRKEKETKRERGY